jgi:hypothetical protein
MLEVVVVVVSACVLYGVKTNAYMMKHCMLSNGGITHAALFVCLAA